MSYTDPDFNPFYVDDPSLSRSENQALADIDLQEREDAMDQGEHILLSETLDLPLVCSCGESFDTDNGWFAHIGEALVPGGNLPAHAVRVGDTVTLSNGQTAEVTAMLEDRGANLVHFNVADGSYFIVPSNQMLTVS